jgi:hypothetical protein
MRRKEVVPLGRGGRIVFGVFSAMFLWFAAVLAWDSYQRVSIFSKTSAEVSTHAQITHAKVTHRSRGRSDFDVSYSYPWEGTTYTGHWISLFREELGFRHWLVKAHHSGQAIKVWIDPADPSCAVIDREWRGLPLVWGVSLAVVCLALARVTFKTAKRGTTTRWLPRPKQDEAGLVAVCKSRVRDEISP